MDRLHKIYKLEPHIMFSSQELVSSPARFIEVWQTIIKAQRENQEVPVENVPVVVAIETEHIADLKVEDWYLVVDMLDRLKPRVKYLSVRGEDDGVMKRVLGKFERWPKGCTLVGVEVDYTGSRNCTNVTFASLGGLLKRAAPTLEYLLLRRITYGSKTKNAFELKKLTHLRVEETRFSQLAKPQNAQNEIAEMYVKPSAPTLHEIKLSELVLDDSLVTPYTGKVLEKVVEYSRIPDSDGTCLDEEAEDYFSDDDSGPLNFGLRDFQDALPDSENEPDGNDGFDAVEFSQAANVLGRDDEPVVVMSQALEW